MKEGDTLIVHGHGSTFVVHVQSGPTCTHTPLPFAWCAPRVGGFRTREDERSKGWWSPCRYGVRLDFPGRTYYVPNRDEIAPCADDWWDVSPGWTRCT